MASTDQQQQQQPSTATNGANSETTADNNSNVITHLSESSTTTSNTSSSSSASNTQQNEPIPLLPRFKSPLTATTWHSLLTSMEGRDKLFRLIQYICRLVRGCIIGRKMPNEQDKNTAVGRVFALEGALSLSRQIWRLFKWVSVYVKMGKDGTNKPILSIATDAALAAYYAADNWAFLCKTGIIKQNAGNASRRAGRLWLIAVLSALTASLLQYRQGMLAEKRAVMILERRKKTDQIDEEECEDDSPPVITNVSVGAIRRQRRVAAAIAAKHAADSVVAMSLSRQSALHPALVGLCGGVSSMIGFCQVWPKYMPSG